MSHSPKTEQALGLFSQGYNCAQAILAVYGPEFGIDRVSALKAASVFGGGIARTGGICGAATGALMVLSLRYCDAKPRALLQKPIHKKARRFMEEFAREAGSHNCNAMRGHDPGKDKYVKGNNDRCPGFVALACRLLEKYL